MSTTSKFSSLTSSSNDFDLPSLSASTVTTPEVRQGAGADSKNVAIKKEKKKSTVKQQQRQNNDPICSIIFCILMQCAMIALVGAGIMWYWLHDWVLSAAYLSAGCQSLLLIILGLACCVCMRSVALNSIAVLALLVIGLTEFVMVVYVSIMDELHDCKEDDCIFFGNTKEKYTFVCLHATFALIHGIFLCVFCSQLCTKSSTKTEKEVVTNAQALPSTYPPATGAAAQQQRQLQTHPVKRGARSQSFHSSQASSSSKASSAAASYPPRRRSRRSLNRRRRPRSRSLSSMSTRSMASTQFPETSSMRSYLPPMRLQKSQYTPSVISGCSVQHCPIAPNYCNVSTCPYYRPAQAQQVPQQQFSMLSQQQYQLVPYYSPPAVPGQAVTLPQQIYPGYAPPPPNGDPSRPIVIDMPQQAGNNGNGFIEIQRVIINMPQNNQNQAPYQPAPAVGHQHRSVAAAPPPPPAPAPRQSESQQNPHETVYYTSVIPISKK